MLEKRRTANLRNGYLPCLIFIIGFTNNIIPTLILLFTQHTQAQSWQIMLLQSVFFINYFAAVIPGFVLLQRFGEKRLTIASAAICMLTTAITGCVIHRLNINHLLLITFGLATGIVLLRVIVNAKLMSLRAHPTYHQYVMTVLTGDTIGALLSPTISAYFLLPPPTATIASIASGAIIFFALISISFGLVILHIANQTEEKVIPTTLNHQHFITAMKNKSVQSGFSMIFIFIGLEFSIPIFMGLLANQNGSSADSALLISAYWTFLFIGRVISIRLQSIFTPKHMIIGSATLSISLILLLQILTTQNSMWLTSLGLLNACMYPSIFSHHTKKLDESLHYVASGVLLMGLSGGAIIPLAQALAAEYVGIHMSFSVIIACYIYLIWMLQPAVAHRSISTHNSYHEAT